MHSTTPIRADSIAKGSPDTMSQIKFKRKDPAPPPYRTSFPNGKKLSAANLKHCIPTGMPIIVIHQRQPVSVQLRPLMKPPNINQSKLPRQPILSLISIHSTTLYHPAARCAIPGQQLLEKNKGSLRILFAFVTVPPSLPAAASRPGAFVSRSFPVTLQGISSS